MNYDQLFRNMFYDIWQGNNISSFDNYYSKNFHESITSSDLNGKRIVINMDYHQLKNEAISYSDKYKDVTINIEKLVASDNYISVCFYSTMIDKHTHSLLYRCVSGIWHLDENNKIDRVWAVVTPL